MTGHAEWREGQDGRPVFYWKEKCR